MVTNLEFLVITMVQKEFHRQAEQHRLYRLNAVARPSRTGKVMAWTGRHLVALGERLQTRATPTVAMHPNV